MTLVFGHRDWIRRGEFLSVFFAMISPLRRAAAALHRDGSGSRARPQPARRRACGRRRRCRSSGVLFLLFALASVSFDGLSRTFFWLGLIGVNPLEFPGRSAVVGVNTLGLLAAFLALVRRLLPRRLCRRAADAAARAAPGGRRPLRLVDRADRARLSLRTLPDRAAGQRPIRAGRAVRPVLAGLEPVRHGPHARQRRHRQRLGRGLDAVERAGRRHHRRPRAGGSGRASPRRAGCIRTAGTPRSANCH